MFDLIAAVAQFIEMPDGNGTLLDAIASVAGVLTHFSAFVGAAHQQRVTGGLGRLLRVRIADA